MENKVPSSAFEEIRHYDWNIVFVVCVAVTTFLTLDQAGAPY